MLVSGRVGSRLSRTLPRLAPRFVPGLPGITRRMHSLPEQTKKLIENIRSGRGLRNFTKKNAVMAGITGVGKGFKSLHLFSAPFKKIYVGILGISFIAGAGQMLAGDRQLFDSFKKEAEVRLLGLKPPGAEFEHATPYRYFQNLMIDLSSPSHGFSDKVLATGYETLAELWSTKINTSWEHKETNGIYNYVFSDAFSKDPTKRKDFETSLTERATKYQTEKGVFPKINDNGILRPASTLKEFVDYSLTRINNSRDNLIKEINNESIKSSNEELAKFFNTASNKLSQLTNENLIKHSEIDAAAEEYSKIALQARLKPETTLRKLSELTKDWPLSKQMAVAEQIGKSAKFRGAPAMAGVIVGLMGTKLGSSSSSTGNLLGGGNDNNPIYDNVVQQLIDDSNKIESVPPLNTSKTQKELIESAIQDYRYIASTIDKKLPLIEESIAEELVENIKDFNSKYGVISSQFSKDRVVGGTLKYKRITKSHKLHKKYPKNKTQKCRKNRKNKTRKHN